MRNEELLEELKKIFRKHGGPREEEPAWAVVSAMLVLVIANQEKIMADLAATLQKANDASVALDDLKVAVAAFKAAGGGTTGGPLSADDQAKVDGIFAALDQVVTKVADIKSLVQPQA